MEDRVRQIVVGPQQGVRQGVVRGRVQLLDVAVDTERGPHGGQLGPPGGLVAGEGDLVGVHEAEVDPALASGGDHLGGPARDPDGQRVEVRAVHDLGAARPQARGEQRRVPVCAPRDGPQPFRAVVDRVHPGHDGEQHLRGTDIAGGLLAADVLLTGLERQPVRLVAVGVHGDPDEAGPAGCARTSPVRP